MSDINVSPVTEEARDFVIQGFNETFLEHHRLFPEAFSAESADTSSDEVRQIVDVALSGSPDAFSILIARAGDDLAGYIVLQPTSPTSALIFDIYVAKKNRRRRVASVLLDHAQRLAIEKGWNCILANVWDGNAASHALFTSAGYGAAKQNFLARMLRTLHEQARYTLYVLEIEPES